MARRRKKARRGVRKRARRVYRRARAAARRVYARARRRRPAVAARRAPARRRRRTNKNLAARQRLPKMGVSIAAGVGGAIGAAALVNAAPIADNRTKALVATAAGLGAWLMLPRKQRVLRYAAVGATLGGALSLTKQMFPGVPMMAGAEPYMGINMRPTYPRIASSAARQHLYDRARDRSFAEATRSGRNSQFMGNTGPSFTTGAQYGKFLTPANM